ncbi:T9SS type A sorting domain-containing protein [Hymenobacter guriensis]|uniref:T9SS type A sorting domain-containing protein n=1 Tax=Hymenobacter guriensis TaxID=2793065 RepID=A0ABS0L121_9BACT|nr:T9SS type A sorting domain-containing protein [Hymenobacter guriensis]MBG8553680.1 T9SS type A sorting domain-containing protein [Hymenobacter guriensis]
MPIRALLPALSLVVMLLASLWPVHQAAAQAAPSWESARLVGLGSLSVDKVFDAAGNLYDAGYFTETITIGGTTLKSKGAIDVYLAKFSPTGALLWVRQLGTANDELIYGICLDAANNVYLTGTFTASLDLGNGVKLTGNSNPYNFFAFVLRYSSQGIAEWAQQNSSNDYAAAFANKASVDAAGNVVVIGLFSASLTIDNATITTSPFTTAFFLATFSSSGVLQSLVRVVEYPSLPSPVLNVVYIPTAVVAKAGAVYIVCQYAGGPVFDTGTTFESEGVNDIFVAKYTTSGSLEWVQKFGGPSIDIAWEAQVDEAGNVYIAGYFEDSISAGDITLTSNGQQDGFLAKYSPQGKPLWVRSFGSSGIDAALGLELDAAGNPFITGQFQGEVAFPPFSVTTPGTNALVAAYTPQGVVRWVQSAGGNGQVAAGSIGFDKQGDILVVGSCYGECSIGSTTLTSWDAYGGIFVARLRNNLPLATAAALPLPQGLYPNPATNLVHLPGLPTGTNVQVVDALGRIVRQAPLSPATTISVQGLAPALYILRATTAQGQKFAGRVVVE